MNLAETTKIGFIGTGVMGKSMARHLMKSKYPVHIYSRTKEKAKDLVEEGAIWEESVAALAAGCQVISGGGYINHNDEIIDCWRFAAPNYSGLPGLTRAAYNVLLDLVTVFSRDARVSGGDLLHYTLIDEKDLAL